MCFRVVWINTLGATEPHFRHIRSIGVECNAAAGYWFCG